MLNPKSRVGLGLNFGLLHDKSFYDNLQLATKISSHLCSFFAAFGNVVCWRTSCAVSKWAANAHDQRRLDYSFFQRVSRTFAWVTMCSFNKEVLCTAKKRRYTTPPFSVHWCSSHLTYLLEKKEATWFVDLYRLHLVDWTHTAAETSDRQSVIVSAPEYCTTPVRCEWVLKLE